MLRNVLGEQESKDFPRFDGNRSNFKQWKKAVALKTADVLKYGYIHDAGVSCKDVFIKEYETCTATKRKTFSTEFKDHSPNLWIQAILDSHAGRKMISQSAKWMVDHMGTNWTDWAKLGYVDEDAHTDAVIDERLDWILFVQRDFLTRLIKAIFGDDPDAQQTAYVDTLRPIILTSENRQLLDGTYDNSKWAQAIESQPAVKTWARLLYRFEGIVDPQAFNLPADFNHAFTVATGTAGKNIRQLDALLEEHEVELTKLYKDNFKGFYKALRLSYLTTMINNLAVLDTPDTASWISAKTHLQNERLANGVLSMEQVYHAIKMAEDQNIVVAQARNAKLAQAKAATANKTAVAPDAATVQEQLDKHLAEVKAMLASQAGAKGGPTDNSKRKRNRWEKNKPGAKQGGKQPDGTTIYTYPECTKCGRHHQGGAAACIQGRDLSAEKLALEKKERELSTLLKIQARAKPKNTDGPNAAERRQANMAASAVASLSEIKDDDE